MVALKSSFRLISVMVIATVVVFVCTIFISYPLDLAEIEYLMTSPEMRIIYENAQVSLADVIIVSTAGMFGSLAALILMFFVRQFINDNSAALGILKALGYSENRLALDFAKFGLSVSIGAVVGYLSAILASPAFYDMLTSNYTLPADVVFKFRFHVFLMTVIVPSVFFSVLAVSYARLRLRRKTLNLINEVDEIKVNKLTQKLQGKGSALPFLKELRKSMLTNNLMLIFFIGFAAFAFSGLVQTAFTMRQLIDKILMTSTFALSGLIVGSVTLLLALEFIIGKNKKYIAMLKAYGYTKSECGKAIFGGYRIATYIGFVLGTIYQFLLIDNVITTAFDNIAIEFDNFGFFIALSVFIFAYELTMLLYNRRVAKVPLREIMQA